MFKIVLGPVNRQGEQVYLELSLSTIEVQPLHWHILNSTIVLSKPRQTVSDSGSRVFDLEQITPEFHFVDA
jgi:hypothetical protein